MIPLIVTGSGGKLGGFLRRAWAVRPPKGLAPLWLGRGQGFDLSWDILDGPPPALPEGAVLLHLAGILRGSDADLAQNSAMVAPLLAACRQNKIARLLVASTTAVYAPRGVPEETTPPDPQNAYGQAKLAMEAGFAAADLPVTFLRIANVVGAQALLDPSASGGVRLDPVAGQEGGPLRSWIGPQTFADVIASLAQRPDLPRHLNLSQSPPLPMAALLTAAGRDWVYGAENPHVLPVAVQSNALLQGICPMPEASPEGLIAELRALSGATRGQG